MNEERRNKLTKQDLKELANEYNVSYLYVANIASILDYDCTSILAALEDM